MFVLFSKLLKSKWFERVAARWPPAENPIIPILELSIFHFFAFSAIICKARCASNKATFVLHGLDSQCGVLYLKTKALIPILICLLSNNLEIYCHSRLMLEVLCHHQFYFQSLKNYYLYSILRGFIFAAPLT